ncbi:hypothetical protein ANTRET_LOCUS10711 [Anthophora retusa]
MSCSLDEMRNLIKLATECQQFYYELLPDWFQYDIENYELMRHKIGYALFGPPNINKDVQTSTTLNSFALESNWQNDTFNVIYSKDMCEAINAIYVQIIEHGKRHADNSIYLGIIFNVILLNKDSKKLSKISKKSSEEAVPICAIPVFKIKQDNFDVWYIDGEARVYKSWTDYIKNNTLPKCTMVLPKQGFYQCDPSYKVTKYVSTVWVESMDSPACSIKNKVLQGVDIATNVVSICAGVGLGIASLMTPVTPVLIVAGAVYTGISGSWIVGRSSQRLVDLATHKQSINLTNKNALSAWLGISSSILAFGTSGGTILLSKAITSGNTITTAARLAYNSVLLSNLTVNGIGIVFQGYCLINKYQREKEIDMLDVIVFTSHVLFFSNTLMNVKLAGELIQTSRGTILERIKNALRLNRFNEQFNKIQVFSNTRVTEIQNESEGIVHKVQKVTNAKDFFRRLPSIGWNNGNIVINNKIFIDPVIFTGQLLSIGACSYNILQPLTLSDTETNVIIQLKNSLKEKIRNFYKDKEPLNGQLPDVSYFSNILREIKYTTDPLEILSMIFKISVSILKYHNDPRQFLFDAIFYTWTYCKANLKSHGVVLASSSPKQVYTTMTNIVNLLYDSIDEIGNELFIAFYTYISSPKENIPNYT